MRRGFWLFRAGLVLWRVRVYHVLSRFRIVRGFRRVRISRETSSNRVALADCRGFLSLWLGGCWASGDRVALGLRQVFLQLRLRVGVVRVSCGVLIVSWLGVVLTFTDPFPYLRVCAWGIYVAPRWGRQWLWCFSHGFTSFRELAPQLLQLLLVVAGVRF